MPLRSLGPRKEEGAAVVFAIQVVSILTLMVAATLSATMALSSTTEDDVSGKDALAAALSGLDVARYRLEQVNPADAMCMTDTATATGSGGAAAGECPPYVGDLGNGTSYRYHVTPVITGGTCGGQTVTPSANTRRCITASGTSNGVTRRTQALLQRSATTTALFPFNGMLGLEA